MTLNTTIPDNHNYMQSNNFKVVIPDLPFVSYTITEGQLPGMNFGIIEQGTRVSMVNFTGTQVVFDEITFSFKVDELGLNWIVAYGWLKGISNIESMDDIEEWLGSEQDMIKEADLTKDITLIITNNNEKPVLEIVLVNSFPIALSGIPFTTGSPEEVVCDMTLRYDYLKINRINV